MMRRPRLLRERLVRLTMLALAVAGCNAILDNKPGVLISTTTPSDEVPDDETSMTDREPPNRGGSRPPPDDSPHCPEGMRVCGDACVAANDPRYGCSDPRCRPCDVPHAEAACAAGACVVESCRAGYADCNDDPSDGCETDLSSHASCGACGEACPSEAPLCAPAGRTFRCTNGCPASAPLVCGGQCVSPLTHVEHCGECGARCAELEHADVTCEEGACVATCRPGYHPCANGCAADDDPAACGAGCATCNAPANAAALCRAGLCDFRCAVGFDDCNDDLRDGCETNLTTDAHHCGQCGAICTGTCVDGTCLDDAEP